MSSAPLPVGTDDYSSVHAPPLNILPALVYVLVFYAVVLSSMLYRGPRMVLAAAGAVDHDQLVKSAEEVFGKVPDETPDTSVAALVHKV